MKYDAHRAPSNDRPRKRHGHSPFVSCAALVCAIVAAQRPIVAVAEDAAAVETRLSAAVKYLASDELEGRGVGTDGINKAADYIAAEFAKIGLKTEVFGKSPFQSFEVTYASELGPKEKNSLELAGPPKGDKPRKVVLKLGDDFNTLAISGSGKVSAPLVFVGYGIGAKEHKFDEYQGVDVKGKVVLILRKEPQQNNPHSVFDGTKNTRYAFFSEKVSNAYSHGAAAVILINDRHGIKQTEKTQSKAWQAAVDKLVETREEFAAKKNPTPEDVAKYRAAVNRLAAQIQEIGNRLEGDLDQVLTFRGAGSDNQRKNMPVYFAKRAVFDPIIKEAFDGLDLAGVEAAIDKDLKPHSRELSGWTAVGEANVVHKRAEVKNVVAVLEGEGPLANETVVVGAHYDHLGYGGRSNRIAPQTIAIHNGADDNASGTAALLEIARTLANRNEKPRRRVVFIAFTAEESGLLGSARYVREPAFSLKNTVAMVNMDMVGRLNDNKLVVHGTETAKEFDKLIDKLNDEHSFKITKKPGGFGPSDHSSFYAKEIPVFHVFTGTHKDYHRPTDDFEKINVAGMVRVANFVGDIVTSIANSSARPTYQAIKAPQIARGGTRPYFGSIPDFAQEVEGYALMGVSKGSPADRAGLKSGDVIVKLGDAKIGGLEDFDSALRKYKAFDKVKVVVKRKEQTVTLTVTLDPPR